MSKYVLALILAIVAPSANAGEDPWGFVRVPSTSPADGWIKTDRPDLNGLIGDYPCIIELNSEESISLPRKREASGLGAERYQNPVPVKLEEFEKAHKICDED